MALKKQSPDEYSALVEKANILIETKDVNVNPGSKVNEMSYRDVYKDWLLSLGKSESVVDHMMAEFDAISAYAMEKKVSALDMWTITNAKQYVKYMRALLDYKYFRVLQKERYKFFKNNSKSYLDFLKQTVGSVMGNASVTSDVSENESALTEIDKKIQTEFPVETKSIYRVLKEDSRHAYLTVEQIKGMYPSEEWGTGSVLDQKPIWEAISSQYANGATGSVTYAHPLNYIGNI